MRLELGRGLYEPSLVVFGGRYHLTLRNDLRGYHSTSGDGLQFAEPKAWTFDDGTEQVIVPERGAELGNFGAASMSVRESWITVSEGMFMKDSRARGAEGATFVARIRWAKPNRLVATP